MRTFKTLAIGCLVMLASAKLFAQTEQSPVKDNAKTEVADPVDAFLNRYQNYLEDRSQPVKKKKIAAKDITPKQNTVSQKDVTDAFNRLQVNSANLKYNSPPAMPDAQYHLYQWQAQDLNLKYLNTSLDLKVAMNTPAAVAPAAQLNSEAEKLAIIKKAIADKKELDKETAEKEDKTGN